MTLHLSKGFLDTHPNYSIVNSNQIETIAKDEIPPTRINLPGAHGFKDAYGKLFLPLSTSKQVAVVVSYGIARSADDVLIYNYETGQLMHTFTGKSYVTNLYERDGKLWIQYNWDPIKVYDIQSGQEMPLPNTWKKISRMCMSADFFVHVNQVEHADGKEAYIPLDLHISDPLNHKTLKVISLDYTDIQAMKIHAEKLFVMALDSQHSVEACEPNTWVKTAALMIYDQPHKSDKKWKVSFTWDVNAYMPPYLNVHRDVVYSRIWSPTVTCLWDINTLETVLAKKKEKDTDSLVEMMDDYAVYADSREISIYKIQGVVEVGGMVRLVPKDLPILQHTGTKNFELLHKIHCSVDKVLYIKLFHFQKTPMLAEGYPNGKVIIRSLEKGHIVMKLVPPENLLDSDYLEFFQDKLLVRYSIPWQKDILAIIWDLHQQAPVQWITRTGIKDTLVAQKDVIQIHQNDLLALSHNQFICYKNVLKS